MTIDPSREIITDGALLVQGQIVATVGKALDLNSHYPDEPITALPNRIIIPGLINSHMHTAQILTRGIADDLELVSWLCEGFWPLRGDFIAEDGYAAARLSIAEMLLSGTT